jgi:carbon starvation protein CstA
MTPLIQFAQDSPRMRRLARRFSLLDAMVLIAATAAGLTIDRVFWSDMHGWDGAVLKHFRDLTSAGIILSVPLAAMWTIATLALQLRRPRYRLRRLLERPGTAACCAATVALALGAGLVICASRGTPISFASRLIMGYGLPMMAGSAVTAVCTVSMIAREYRAAPDWNDRLGRLIGLYWVMSTLVLGWALTG